MVTDTSFTDPVACAATRFPILSASPVVWRGALFADPARRPAFPLSHVPVVFRWGSFSSRTQWSGDLRSSRMVRKPATCSGGLDWRSIPAATRFRGPAGGCAQPGPSHGRGAPRGHPRAGPREAEAGTRVQRSGSGEAGLPPLALAGAPAASPLVVRGSGRGGASLFRSVRSSDEDMWLPAAFASSGATGGRGGRAAAASVASSSVLVGFGDAAVSRFPPSRMYRCSRMFPSLPPCSRSSRRPGRPATWR